MLLFVTPGDGVGVGVWPQNELPSEKDDTVENEVSILGDSKALGDDDTKPPDSVGSIEDTVGEDQGTSPLFSIVLLAHDVEMMLSGTHTDSKDGTVDDGSKSGRTTVS